MPKECVECLRWLVDRRDGYTPISTIAFGDRGRIYRLINEAALPPNVYFWGGIRLCQNRFNNYTADSLSGKYFLMQLQGHARPPHYRMGVVMGIGDNYSDARRSLHGNTGWMVGPEHPPRLSFVQGWLSYIPREVVVSRSPGWPEAAEEGPGPCLDREAV